MGPAAASSKTEISKSAAAVKKNSTSPEKEKEEPSDVLSREYSDKDFAPESYSGSLVWDFIKTLIILGLLVWAFYFFFKFIKKQTGIQTYGEGVAQTLCTVPIGQNKFLHIVELAGRVLVLGVADGGVNLITEITERDQIDRIRLESSRSMPQHSGGFQDYLMKNVSRLLGKIGGKGSGKTSSFFDSEISQSYHGRGMDFLRKQRNRLRDLDGSDHE